MYGSLSPFFDCFSYLATLNFALLRLEVDGEPEPPLSFWSRQHELAALFDLVKMYLAIPASSAQDERGFSSAGFLLGELRTQLKSIHFRQEFRVRQFINSGPSSSQHSQDGRESKMERVQLIIAKYTASLSEPRPAIERSPSSLLLASKEAVFQPSRAVDEVLYGLALESSRRPTGESKSTNPGSRDRLSARIAECGLKYRKRIAGDGNCQFASLSDQLTRFGVSASHEALRSKAVAWLRLNGDYKLTNGSSISDFLAYQDDSSWTKYCDSLAVPNAWGDHFTLIALAEFYKLRIVLISSVIGDYITVIVPLSTADEKTVLLAHLHESHYDSLEIIQ